MLIISRGSTLSRKIRSQCQTTMKMLSEPSIPDIEGEYWRIIENPTEEIKVLHGNGTETSGFPLKTNPRDVTDCPQHVESGWNLNISPKLQDSLLCFESCSSSSILLPWLSVGMCFSSNHWATEFSPSILTSEDIPVYRCVQNPREFVLILPGAYHAEFDCGFNCYELEKFAPFDWLPHGQNAVELYREQDRKTSISHDKLLLEAAAEATRSLGELTRQNKNSFDNAKWRAVCRNYGYLMKALQTWVATELRERKYLCASMLPPNGSVLHASIINTFLPLAANVLHINILGFFIPSSHVLVHGARSICLYGLK
ncbi:hypothetical protein P3S68_025707 [Capsicum galapagoense]